jgi:hypothetical protein
VPSGYSAASDDAALGPAPNRFSIYSSTSLRKSSAMAGPRSVIAFSPSTNTGSGGSFAGAGQRDADIGVLGFAGAVDDAAHDRNVEVSTPGYCVFQPGIESRMKSWIGAPVPGTWSRWCGRNRGRLRPAARRCGSPWSAAAPARPELPPCDRRRAPASAKCGWCRRCPAAAECPARPRRRRCPSSPCRLRSGQDGSHSRSAGERLIHGDEVLHRRDLGGEDHLVLRHAEFFGAGRRQQCRLHHRFTRHRANVGGFADSAFSSISLVSSS